MKTTIDLPDDLVDEACAIAVAQQTKLRELMVTALRMELDRRSTIGRVDFRFPPVGGQGRVADLDAASAFDRSYGPPA